MSKIIVAIIVIILSLVVSSFCVMLLWNWIMPVLFGFSTITYGQAIGLYALCAILFKSVQKNDN